MLRKWLVNPLPKGSALAAIFDSCSSGTLLGNVSVHMLFAVAYIQKDLEHYECNDVYRPWVNKGKSKTLQNRVGTSRMIPRPSPSIALSLRAVRMNCKDTGSVPIRPMEDVCTTEPVQLAEESDEHGGERCASSERSFKCNCDGWCRNAGSRTTLDHPDVVCWAFNHPSIPAHLPPRFL